jgi:methylmalonyl-CoA mutase N-terminal domain/subunit
VPLTTDPLGGSYYVESLTNEIEAPVTRLLGEIDTEGGMWKCLESGWLKRQFDETTVRIHSEIDSGERLIAGVNAFQGEDGRISELTRESAYKVPPDEKRYGSIDRVRALKETRDQTKAQAALLDLTRAAREGTNLIRPAIVAAKAYATVGEMIGAMRLGSDYAYDPYGQIDGPDFLTSLAA